MRIQLVDDEGVIVDQVGGMNRDIMKMWVDFLESNVDDNG